MNLEDKKLIAEKLMGWMVCYDNQKPEGEDIYFHNQNKSDPQWVWAHEWNPDTDRNCWPEIWGKMTDEEKEKYMYSLALKLGACFVDKMKYQECYKTAMIIHTAPPEICCKALLEVIKEA